MITRLYTFVILTKCFNMWYHKIRSIMLLMPITMRTIKIEKTYSIACVLDEQSIRRFYSEIINSLQRLYGEGMGPTIKITLGFSDGSDMTTEDVEDLPKEENTSGRRIKQITINGELNDAKVSVSFGTKNNNAINLSITGPDRQWSYVTKSILEDRIKDCKETRPRTWIICLFVIIISAILYYFFIQNIRNHLPSLSTPSKNNSGYDLTLTGWGVFFGLLPISILLVYSVQKLFPNTIFLLGKEIQRHDRIARIRSNLFWGVIIGIPLSLISAFLMKKMGL